MQLEGKLALVTGAGSGMGRALAVEGSQRGLKLALAGPPGGCARGNAGAARRLEAPHRHSRGHHPRGGSGRDRLTP